MGVLKTLARGGSLLLFSEVVVNGCSFLRNWIIARHLSKDDFGIAAVLTTVMSFVELASKMSFGQQIISHAEGDRREFVAAVHFVNASVSLASALLVMVCAGPIASLLGMPQLSGALRWLALIPVAVGCTSLEAFCFSRSLKYGRAVSIEAIPQILTLVAAWPLAAYLRDFRAPLFLMIAKVVLSALTSHVVAHRSFRIGINWSYARDIIGYALPLLLSSFMMVGILQGDRLLIARAYPLSQLGDYALAAMLAAVPSFTIYKVYCGLVIPMLARLKLGSAELYRGYALSAQVVSLVAAAFGIAGILSGEWLIRVMFGARYVSAVPLLRWLVAMHAVRIIRGVPFALGMAMGNTRVQLPSNGIRFVGVLTALPVILLGQSLVYVVVMALVAELLSFPAATASVRKRYGAGASVCVVPLLLCLSCLGVSTAVLPLLTSSAGLCTILLAVVAVIGGAIALYSVAFRETRDVVLGIVRRRFGRGVAGCRVG